ncbi:methyltransferase-like protein 22 isoform X2 [Hyperolius riggenbachi]|uniref:methyltransferase-like protein 22 isoform X2 n=1 Tax=Hyperolius riggenbachi TaxID=752182 RepID=UPI0035A2BD5D
MKHADLGEEAGMEVITFTKDTVLSDIHLHIPHKRHLMVRLNRVGQPVFQTQFKILSKESASQSAKEDCVSITENEDIKQLNESGSLPFKHTTQNDGQVIEDLLDEDGDLEVQRRPRCPSERSGCQRFDRDVVCPTILRIGCDDQVEEEEESSNNNEVVKIEHTMATPLEDVGKQIWRGAFLLADYILGQQDLFRGCTVLELGAGTGFTSIIMATVAKTVYCTDVGHDLLEMCERNLVLNRSFMGKADGQIKVKELDWLKNQLCKAIDIWPRLTLEELIEIVLMSGERINRVIAADFNARHPMRPPICHATVSKLLAKFRETGSVLDLPKCRCMKSVTNEETSVAVLASFSKSPQRSWNISWVFPARWCTTTLWGSGPSIPR